MALTVGNLLNTSGLALNLVGGAAGLSNDIRWVHVSELEDPTPWLKGGELLLTTGIGVGKTPSKQRAYLQRLDKADLAGLGFGLGFDFQKVPKALLDAAEEASFPIFEVPYPVPFIAITEAVFTRLVTEQYDILSRSLDAEHTLTKAVLEGKGVQGIVAALTRATGGWALLVDIHAATITAEPGGARDYQDRVCEELQSPRAEGIRFSLSVVDRGQHISIQPVTAQGRVEAFLAVGKPQALTQFDRIVASHALSLLAIELTKAREVSDTERRLKGDLFDQLLSGSMPLSEGKRILERFGFDAEETFAVAAVSGSEPPERLAQVCEEVLVRRRGGFLVSPREGLVLVLLQPEGSGFLAELRSEIAERSPGIVIAGAGNAFPMERLPQGVREARYALQVCQMEGTEEAEFSDLGTYQLLLSLQDPEALSTFASSVLAPLDAYDARHGGELVSSVRVFLEHNAKWEAAAAQLFIHRHTLRYRMRKVQELTGRNLASARDRMEFLLALRARDLLASDDWPAGALSPSYKTEDAL